MFGPKKSKGLSLNNAKSSSPHDTSHQGVKGSYTKFGGRPSTFPNNVYENDDPNHQVSKDFQKPQKSKNPVTKSTHTSSFVDGHNKSTKNKQNLTDDVDIDTKRTEVKQLPSASAMALTKSTASTKTMSTTISSVTTTTGSKTLVSTIRTKASPPPTSSSATNVSSTSTTNRPAAATSTPPISSQTSQSTSTKTTILGHKNKHQIKSGLFVYNNHAYENSSFDKDVTSPNKETDFQQPTKASTLKKTPKSLTVRPSETNPQPQTKTTSNKSIYSLAGKVPMSYDMTNGFDNSNQKSSSFSSTSISLSSTIKPTSDYSTSSSLSSSSLSSRDSSSISSKSRAAATPDDLWLSRVETALKSFPNDKTHVTSEQLKNALQVKESFVSERFVKLLDKDTDGQIPVDELIDELRALVNGTQTEKLRFLFNVYNTKGNGHIVRNELQTFFTNLIEECKLQISSDNIQAMTNAFFQAADKNGDGKITFDELQTMVRKRPSIVDNIGISPTGTHASDDTRVKRQFRYFSKKYIQNNLKKVASLIILLFINVGLMALAIYLYWDKNTWIKVARAGGLALNFNCTFVLVLMLRHTLTWLRNTWLRHVLPFDQHVLFHRICGYFIALHGTTHTIGHIGNCVVSEDSTGLTAFEQMFTTRAGVGWVKDSAYITGDLLVVVLFVMVVLSLPIVRRSGFFEVFYWSHKLYLVFWAILIIHAPNFWKWFLVPGVIFLIELIARHPCIRAFYMGKTYIEQVSLLPSDVTHLVISRPPGFHFKSGDYVFIQVPVVAKYEWHPFTISSAPENMDEIWLHIRTAGHWTRSLHEYFTDYTNLDEEAGPDNMDLFKGFIKRRASSIAWLKSKPLKARKINSNIRKRVVTKNVKVLVHLDGPYGTPSRHIFEEEHAVLIGSGIGITPFASILQSIVSRYKASAVQCPKCSHLWCHQPPASVMKLKKVDFVWIIRDQRHYEWFTSLLSRLEREQEVEGGLGGILDIHIYMTSVPPKTDMRGMGLQLALDLVHDEEKTDLLTGLRTRTQGGRPDFDKLFSKIQDKSGDRRVKVFFCGSPLLGNTLKLYSHKYNFRFAHEYF